MPRVQFFYRWNAIGEFDTDRIIGTPQYAAFAYAATRNVQREFIRYGLSPHARDFRASIRKVAHNARTGHMPGQVVECCR